MRTTTKDLFPSGYRIRPGDRPAAVARRQPRQGAGGSPKGLETNPGPVARHDAAFAVPAGLLRILDRDFVMAGIARRVQGPDGKWRIDKRDERGRTIDVHALRTTFGRLLSKGGVAPRTAQAAMRHSDIRLTMGVYTDPKLLDVRGALDALPALPLADERPVMRQAVGSMQNMDLRESSLAPTLAPTADNPGQSGSIPGNSSAEAGESRRLSVIDGSARVVKRNEPLTGAVSGSPEWALRDLNPRPH